MVPIVFDVMLSVYQMKSREKLHSIKAYQQRVVEAVVQTLVRVVMQHKPIKRKRQEDQTIIIKYPYVIIGCLMVPVISARNVILLMAKKRYKMEDIKPIC